MLIGSFAFANNGTTTQKSAICSEIKNVESKKIDFQTFSRMLKDSNFRIVEMIKLDEEFLFLDDCGNWWSVQYDSSVYTPYSAFLTASQMIYNATGC